MSASALIFVLALATFFPPLGTTWVETAEGATDPTVGVAWRIDEGRIWGQGVGSRESGTRPVTNLIADGIHVTVFKIDAPATEKSERQAHHYHIHGIILILSVPSIFMMHQFFSHPLIIRPPH